MTTGNLFFCFQKCPPSPFMCFYWNWHNSFPFSSGSESRVQVWTAPHWPEWSLFQEPIFLVAQTGWYISQLSLSSWTSGKASLLRSPLPPQGSSVNPKTSAEPIRKSKIFSTKEAKSVHCQPIAASGYLVILRTTKIGRSIFWTPDLLDLNSLPCVELSLIIVFQLHFPTNPDSSCARRICVYVIWLLFWADRHLPVCLVMTMLEDCDLIFSLNRTQTALSFLTQVTVVKISIYWNMQQ